MPSPRPREIAPGAPAPAGFVPLSVPDIGELERRYVDDAMATGWVSSAGPFVSRFEEQVAELLGASHAVATATGTAALHVALILAGVEPGDEVLTSTLSFVAPANAIRYVGAHPVFVDAEPDYSQIDAELAARFLEEECDGSLVNRATGRRLAAILPVHALGHPYAADAIREVADRFGLPVIEDAAEGLGASYKGAPLGRFGDASALSFNGNKIVTSGGGGMLVTENAGWADRARYLTTTAKDDPFEYVHGEVGFNYRLTNVAAALGAAQLTRLPEFVERKRAIAARYAEAFARVPGVEPMPEADWANASFWMYTVLVDGGSRPLMRALDDAAIQARPLWQPLHQSPAHRGAQAVGGAVAERLYADGLSLPASSSLTEEQQERVIDAVEAAL